MSDTTTTTTTTTTTNATLSALRIPANSVVVIPQCRASGGKSSLTTKIREDAEGNRLETERNVIVTIEDRAEREAAESLASAGTYQIRRLAQHTPVGYMVSRDRLPEIEAGLAEVRQKVEAFHADARHCSVRLGYLVMPLAPDLGPDVARAMADTVREGLERAREAIRAGNLRELQNSILGVQNADQLCTGVLRDSVLMAMDQIRDAARTIREEIKRGVTPASAGATYNADLVDAAIGLFSY